MKAAYPVIFSQLEDGGFMAYVPDFEINTQGEDLAEAIYMARDAIGLMGIDMQDDKKPLPEASDVKAIKGEDGDIVSVVDVDFDEYRRKHDKRAVKKTLTIPAGLNYEGERAGVNFSALLQRALREELNITD